LFTIVKKRKVRGVDLINRYNYLMEVCKEDGAVLFSVAGQEAVTID